MTRFKVVIPARFASTRLPGKPLAEIAGKPMVVRVLERAHAAGAEQVWVATDHPDVEAAVRSAGGQVPSATGVQVSPPQSAPVGSKTVTKSDSAATRVSAATTGPRP